MAVTMAMTMLLSALVVPTSAGGAYASLWGVDLSKASTYEFWDETLFQVADETFGLSTIMMICSHRSQHWFEVWAMWKAPSMADISDVFTLHAAERSMVFMGYFSFLYLMYKLWPIVNFHDAPWVEAILQSNDGRYESGVNVHVRHYMNPEIWWNYAKCNTIRRGWAMFESFWKIRLPKLRNGPFYGSHFWEPYYQLSGPMLFAFAPKNGTGAIMKELDDMFYECKEEKKRYGEDYGVPVSFLMRLKRSYAEAFEVGEWVSKAEKKQLCSGG